MLAGVRAVPVYNIDGYFMKEQPVAVFTGAMALIRWFIAATVTWMLLELFNSLIT